MTVLPCPFCGSDVNEVVIGETFRWLKVACFECGASGPEIRGHNGSEPAIIAWNNRTKSVDSNA